MFSAIADGFKWLYQLLIDLFTFLLGGLLKLLQPIFDLLGIVFEFIYWIGVIIAKVVHLVFSIGKLLIGLITGLFKTILGLGYTGGGRGLPSSYTNVYEHIRPALNTLQLDKVAYILQFTLWILTALMAARIIGNMRGGANE